MSRWLARLRVALRSIVRRRRVDEELNEEIQHHLERQIDEELKAGLSLADAEHAARRALGNIEHAKEQLRDARAGAWIDQLERDLRFGVRAMVRRPGFTCVAVSTIALGIGATTAIFSLADNVLFRPLPFPNADRLVSVWEVRPALRRPRMEAAPLNYVDWRRESNSFEDLAAYFHDSATLTDSGTPERLPIAGVTPNFMSMLRVPPLVGRSFEYPDGTPGRAATTILSYGLWQRRFGGDRTIIGRTIRLSDAPHTVIGVMPRGFQFPHARVQAWIPVDYSHGGGIQNRTLLALNVVGRLKPRVTVAEATTELRVIAERLARQYPENRGASAFAVALQDDLSRNERASFVLLLGAAGLVLLIACANVAGLLLTRGSSRDAEFALRTALGASRGQLVRQLLLEGILLSGVGAIVGLVLATRSFDLLTTLVPDPLRGTVSMSLDLRLLAFSTSVALLTGVVFGLAPLRHAFQRDVRTALGARTRSATAAGRRLRALVAVEVALGVVVLFATALMLQTVLNLERADIGFEKQNVLTARVELSQAEYPTAQHRLNFYDELLERVKGMPTVVAAGLTTFLPYTETIGSAPLRVEGRTDLVDVSRQTYLRAITPGYLRTLRVPLRAGREFLETDTANTEPVAIVSEGVNAALGGHLLGQRVAFGLGGSNWLRVIGIVGDIRYDGVDVASSRGALYVPAAQLQQVGGFSYFFVPRDLAIRTTGNPMTLATTLQQTIWTMNANQPVADIRTLDDLVDAQIVDRKVQTGLLSTFAGLALFMAALGVYGLLSFTVAARTRELGVRAALGARAGELVALVSRGSLRWVAAGLAVGVALALATSRAMTSLIYGVEPMDWGSLLVSTAVLGLTGVAAALLPVWRATRIDPVVILRAE
jgi:putative ABC transport system permease protein